MDRRLHLANQFRNIFERLVNRDEVDLSNPNVSLMFEIIATNLFNEMAEKEGVYFDGAVNITSSPRKSQQIEFRGEMWLGGNGTQWKEPFRVLVTDKNISKQGVRVAISIGSERVEGDLETAFGIVEVASPSSS